MKKILGQSVFASRLFDFVAFVNLRPHFLSMLVFKIGKGKTKAFNIVIISHIN